MCQTAEIRYAHSMRHAAYPEILVVGCVCAEHMSEGYDGKAAEQPLRSRATRRKWWDQSLWHDSNKGNSIYRKTRDNFVAIVFFVRKFNRLLCIDEEKFGIVVKDLDLKETETEDADYNSEDEAKEAAFDLLERMRQERETPYSIRNVPEPVSGALGDTSESDSDTSCEVCGRLLTRNEPIACNQCGRMMGDCCAAPDFLMCRDCVATFDVENQEQVV